MKKKAPFYNRRRLYLDNLYSDADHVIAVLSFCSLAGDFAFYRNITSVRDNIY